MEWVGKGEAAEDSECVAHEGEDERTLPNMSFKVENCSTSLTGRFLDAVPYQNCSEEFSKHEFDDTVNLLYGLIKEAFEEKGYDVVEDPDAFLSDTQKYTFQQPIDQELYGGFGLYMSDSRRRFSVEYGVEDVRGLTTPDPNELGDLWNDRSKMHCMVNVAGSWESAADDDYRELYSVIESVLGDKGKFVEKRPKL